MKKLISVFLLITVLAVSLCGCNSTPKCFSGKWKFSSIVEVELKSDLTQSDVDLLKESYNAQTEEEIVIKASEKFNTEDTFAPFYLKFSKKLAYTHDLIMEREATWSFYKLTENTGFISFYTELDASQGNPEPLLFPDLAYDKETNTMSITMNYSMFMVTLALVR